jgi:hypothetical protein
VEDLDAPLGRGQLVVDVEAAAVGLDGHLVSSSFLRPVP